MSILDRASVTLEFDDHFVIQPTHSFWNHKDYESGGKGKLCPDGFRYSSETNTHWLSDDEIAKLVASVEGEATREPMPRADEPKFIVGG